MIKSKIITQVCSDLKTVNAARVSMAVTHDAYDDAKDTKLINYLAGHAHWTPFAHNREIIFIPVSSQVVYYHLIEYLALALSPEEAASVVLQNKLHYKGTQYVAVKTSLYGWAQILKSLEKTYYKNDENIVHRILSIINSKYPNSTKALLGDEFINNYTSKIDFPARNHDIHNNLLHVLEPRMFDITFYETVPIFVARQRFKHVIMTVYNEISKRYVDDIPEIYIPDVWRERPEKSIKQGSGGAHPKNDVIMEQYESFCKLALQLYDKLVNVDKVAPEMARIVLPQSMMTEYYVTSNMVAWDRFIKQRKDGHAQKEIQDLAIITEEQLNDAKHSLHNILNSSHMIGLDKVKEMNSVGIF